MRKLNLIKRAIYVVFILGVIVVGVIAWHTSRKSLGQDVNDLDVARVYRGDITQVVRSAGQLAPLVSVEVSTQISGLVTEVNVDFNSVVKRGQVLARVDSATYEQRLRQALADLSAAEADAKLAKVTAERLRGLRRSDLVTQEEFDEAQAKLEQTRASLLTRRAALENARVDLQRCTIASPIDGIVIYRQVEVGKTVVSSFSAPTLFVIAQNLTKMKIVARVSEVDVASLRIGAEVNFTVDALPGKAFRGRLSQIRNPYTPTEKDTQGQNLQAAITNFDAVVDVDNDALLLRPSLTANVSIVTSRASEILMLPNGALRVVLPEKILSVASRTVPRGRIKGDESIVYRIRGGASEARVEAVVVRLGTTDHINTAILSGLDEGDKVITGVKDPQLASEARSAF